MYIFEDNKKYFALEQLIKNARFHLKNLNNIT